MGMLVEGEWRPDGQFPTDRGGGFTRPASGWRHWVTPGGEAGPSGEGGFPAEPGRYHLYVSLACPWAHRALILRCLKGLDSLVGLSVVHWLMRDDGWTFAPGPGVRPDEVLGSTYLHQVYTASDPGYTGRVTVPVLWDKRGRRIVSNESSEIIRMMNSAFDGIGAAPGDYYPTDLRPEIDAVNARVYETLNNGVYRCGFAQSQAAYEAAVAPLFETLDWLEARLSKQDFLVGETLTEADIRLFTTLVRFDAVYHGHFKCNLRRLVDYPGLSAYLERLSDWPGIAGTVDLHHIKHHYYESHLHINPTGIVPAGPAAILRRDLA